MSRNLGRTDCFYCGCDIKILENPRLITESEAGFYYNTHKDLVVAIAECPACLAKYLAWFRSDVKLFGEFNTEWFKSKEAVKCMYDLSFRHSFNDEPNERDLPRYNIEREIVYNRVGPFVDTTYMNLIKIKSS